MYNKICAVRSWGVGGGSGEWGGGWGGGSNSDMHRGRVVFKGYDHKS